MSISEFSNLKANISSMYKFLAENNITLSADDKMQIKSIFDQANVEKETDKNIEEQLTGNERNSFLEKIENLPKQIKNCIIAFFQKIEKAEEMKRMEEETLKESKQLSFEKDLTNKNIVKQIPLEERTSILNHIKINYPNIFEKINATFTEVEQEELDTKIDEETSKIFENNN